MKLLQQIKPRKVIVVRGTPEKCDTLKSFCEQIALGGDKQRIDVYSPNNGEVLDVTTESFIYQVRLTESLVKNIEYSRGKDGSQLAWIEGIINHSAEESADIIKDLEEEGEEEESSSLKKPRVPLLESAPMDLCCNHQATFINELKLSDFKAILTKNGISSEFQGGVLFCGEGFVALRRLDSGRITIEGSLCPEYYRVRELLYDQYAIV
eukprot:TRINITY_DN3678_c0_g1_i3.p1 TRINITY_DN3678_c0_g1~~TRINITY_DN3678_c0_g1_i3.p1  ORF type:complete len:209 (-),score=79.24 TRINITY_DN3678_c0_g1_i3:603-1229(-)